MTPSEWAAILGTSGGLALTVIAAVSSALRRREDVITKALERRDEAAERARLERNADVNRRLDALLARLDALPATTTAATTTAIEAFRVDIASLHLAIREIFMRRNPG